MKYETIRGLQIPKIGFGTWSIGGGYEADPALDDRSMRALRSALELGYTHFDTAERYAAGHAEELLGRAMRETNTPRERVFITTKVSPEYLSYEDVLAHCENSLRRLETEYLDMYLIHWPMAGMDLKETYRAFNKLARDGKIRHPGVSNFDVDLLKQAVALSETPILTDQAPYSIGDRTYAKNGVLEYCQKHDILFTAYSPLKRGRARSNEALQAVARARGVTPEQIALAWATAQPRVITIPLSFDPRHQKENLDAGDIVLTDEELKQLI